MGSAQRRPRRAHPDQRTPRWKKVIDHWQRADGTMATTSRSTEADQQFNLRSAAPQSAVRRHPSATTSAVSHKQSTALPDKERPRQSGNDDPRATGTRATGAVNESPVGRPGSQLGSTPEASRIKRNSTHGMPA